MKNISELEDKRIKAINYAFEISINDYLEIASKILENNEFQRKKVKSSSTVYALLKNDLKEGCVIPPLVLALENNENPKNIKGNDINFDFLKRNTSNLLILDGLQRTYTLIELRDELAKEKSSQYKSTMDQKLRIELYIGINRIAILYRMLTLNTGQTPMSLRHQIEILYSDYTNRAIGDIKLIAEADEERARNINEYVFRDIIDGFHSYLERNELPIEKTDLLENIAGLEKLSKENQDKNIFESFAKSFDNFIKKMFALSSDWKLTDELNNEMENHAFGTDILSIFKKNQVLTAFGAAVGRLKDYNKITDFDALTPLFDRISFNSDTKLALNKLLWILNEIRIKSKKIGNAQRMYFQYFFRELLNPETDSYLKIDRAIDNAYQKYQSQI